MKDSLHNITKIANSYHNLEENQEVQITKDTVKQKICVIGYYNRKNLGDDMFKITIPMLFTKEKYQFDFFNINDGYNLSDYEIIIFGGGDLFVPFFMEKLQKKYKGYNGRIYTIGTGFSHTQDIYRGYTYMFDHILLREKHSCDILKPIIGEEYITTIPDLGFLLNAPQCDILSTKKEKLPLIGIFLATPLLQKDNYYSEVKECLSYLSTVGNVVCVRFNVSGHANEDDKTINDKICVEYPTILNNYTVYNTEDMLKFFSKCTFAVCSRFHSHIFSIITGCPFISISYNRKVARLLEENSLDSLIYQDITQLSNIYNNRENISKQLNDVYIKNNRNIESINFDIIINNSRKRNRSSLIEKLHLINEEISDAIIALTDYHPDGKDKKPIERVHAISIAKLICYKIMGNVDCRYLYGTIDNIMNSPWNYKEIIYWIMRDINTVKN